MPENNEELTPEQQEALEKARAEAEAEAQTPAKGFNEDCNLCDSRRVSINGLLLCSGCDWVKIREGKAFANPVKK